MTLIKTSILRSFSVTCVLCLEVAPQPYHSAALYQIFGGVTSTFSAKEIVPILRESEDTSRSDSKNVLPSYDDPRNDSVTFSNPLFEFDVNFNSSNINPLFDEELDDIEDDVELLLHHDPSTPMKSIASILEGFIDEQPFEENDNLFDLEFPLKEGYYELGRRQEDIIDNLLNDDPIPEYERLTFDMEPDVPVINNVDELNKDECFDPRGVEINVEVDDSFTFVTRTFLPYLTYPEVSPLLYSTKNEDAIFDPGIST
ncbi:hypothetical protein Tco_0226404 [Tanacetum coccineum]